MPLLSANKLDPLVDCSEELKKKEKKEASPCVLTVWYMVAEKFK